MDPEKEAEMLLALPIEQALLKLKKMSNPHLAKIGGTDKGLELCRKIQDHLVSKMVVTPEGGQGEVKMSDYVKTIKEVL